MTCLKPQREPGGDKNRGGVLWPVPVLAAPQTALFYVHPVLPSPWCFEEPSRLPGAKQKASHFEVSEVWASRRDRMP